MQTVMDRVDGVHLKHAIEGILTALIVAEAKADFTVEERIQFREAVNTAEHSIKQVKI